MSFYKASSRHRLYRRILLCATCALMLASAAAQGGQRDIYGRPTQDQKPETTSSKKQRGPRAIAVIRWDADVKDKAVPKLIPVCILDDGQFYDASIYKAAPAPMPILAGIVYEAQDKGELLGYFTTQKQLKLPGKENWIALGDWQSASPPMEKLDDNRKSSVEVVRGNAPEQTGSNPGDNNDDRDLNKKKTTVYDENGNPMPEGTQASPAAPMGGAGNTQPRIKTTPDKSPSADSTNSADKKASDDPDRPTIKRQTGSDSTGSSAPTQTPTQPPQSTQQTKTSTDQASDVPLTSANDPDRPKLKRGKPTELPQIEPPKSKDDPDRPLMKHGSNAANNSASKQQAILVPPRVLDRGPLIGESNEGDPVLKRTRTYEAVAVSDATPEQPNVFRYKMAQSEKEELQAKLDALAQDEVDKYLRSIGRGKASPDAQKPASKTTAKNAAKKRTATPRPEDRKSEFAETQFEVLDLSHRNDPVLVFSGRERTMTQSGATAGAAQDVYVTYVARVGYEGNPQGIFRSVTVNDRLDVTPKLELIDAVDADGNGLGELLFRRVADDGAVFALYRVGFDRMTELFHGGTAD
jgi:hypothetical protein